MSIFANLPAPQPRTRGTLLSSIDEIQSEWLDAAADRVFFDGISLIPWMTDGPNCGEVGCDVEYNKLATVLPEWIEQRPFLLWDALECSNLGNVSSLVGDRVMLNIDRLRSHAYAAELETAACSGGIGLIGNEDYAPEILTGGPVAEVIFAFEAFLADQLHGAIGTIHLSAAAFAQADDAGLLRYDNARGVFRTITGHIVIGDSGHTGQATPEGGSAPAAGQSWAYATSDVFYLETDVSPVWQTNLLETGRRNRDRLVAERFAILVFDPTNTAAALVDETTE